MEKEKGTIYESKEELGNLQFQLERLQDQGVFVADLPDQVWNKIVERIEKDDERKLVEVRNELNKELSRKND